MAAILLFGIMGLPAAAGQRSAERRLPDDPGAAPRSRAPARRRWRPPSRRRSSSSSRRSPGIDSMTSTSALGLTQITLQFNLERDIDAAAQDVQAAIAAAARLLPPSMPTPPSYRKVNPADQPILFLALSSPTLPLSDGRRVRRDATRAAHLDGRRRRAGPGLRRAEVRGARPARSACARRARHRHRRSASRRSSAATSTCRPARSTAAQQAFDGRGDGPAQERRARTAR